MSTTITGFGIAPLGIAPLGLGSPASSDALTLTNYGALISMAIDPVTRDYMLDANGQEYDMGSSGQRVWMCLATLKGSRRNQLAWGLGVPTHLGDSALSDTREAVRVALLPCTSDGSIEVIDTQIEVDPQKPTTLYALVTWRDRTTTASPVIFRTQF
jgi:hypothetical protein